MNNLFNRNQEFSIVPQNFKYSNKGRIIQIFENSIVLELEKPPTGLEKLKINEFYSQTRHGTLYFNAAIAKIEEDKNIIVVMKPKKHRFLQRRTFTRIKYVENIVLKTATEEFPATTMDLAAGGIKIKTDACLDLNTIYDTQIPLAGGNDIVCKFQPIKMEKDLEDDIYISAGKLLEVDQKDKMRIIQYCLRKDIEYNKR